MGPEIFIPTIYLTLFFSHPHPSQALVMHIVPQGPHAYAADLFFFRLGN